MGQSWITSSTTMSSPTDGVSFLCRRSGGAFCRHQCFPFLTTRNDQLTDSSAGQPDDSRAGQLTDSRADQFADSRTDQLADSQCELVAQRTT